MQTNESHSWGQWRGLPDEILIGLSGPATSPGDFDRDGDVDGHDFLVLHRNPNVGDLSDWQANYGTSSIAAASTAVPQPGSLALLAALITLCFAQQRRFC